jgi:hypothetical protein
MTELIESVWLYGEDGTKYLAHLHQAKIKASSFDGSAFILGAKTGVLEDGTPLNFLDPDTFKNAATGELLSRIGPAEEKEQK